MVETVATGRERLIVFLLVGGLLCGACSPSLNDLAQKHRATRQPAGAVEDGGLVFLESPRHWGTDVFQGGSGGSNVRQAFTKDGVYLQLGPPGFRKALWLPPSAIAACARVQAPNGIHPWRTGLWIEDSRVLILFADGGGGHDALKWCTQHGLEVVDHATVAGWLHDGSEASGR